MTAMLPPTTPLQSPAAQPGTVVHYVWPAVTTVILHAAVFALLLGNWSPAAPAVDKEKVLTTRLVTLSVEPVVEPAPAPVPEPIPVAPITPAEPPPAPVTPAKVAQPAEPAKPTVDQAAIARKRAQEQERLEQQRQARLEEQQRQEQARLEELQRQAQEQERERQRQALAAEQARQQAEAQRLLAAQAKQAAEAASISQYQPVSKKPPAYPKRALDQRKEGDCTVEYTVTEQGKVDNPVVVDGGCDDPVFARPALASAKSFRYKPRVVDGVAVAVPGVRNTFRFRLEH